MAKAVGIVILGSFLIAIPAAVIGTIVAGDVDIQEDADALTIVLISSLLVEGVILFAALRFSVFKYRNGLFGAVSSQIARPRWADLGLRRPQRGGWWLPPALAMIGIVAVLVFAGVLELLGADAESNVPEKAFDNAGPVILIAVLSLAFAPVIEEIFFRGFIFGGLRGRWGTLGAAAASGVLFGLAHLGNPGDVLVTIPIGVVGFIFALGYAYSGSIVASMIAHFLFNLISFLTGLLA
jgi:membrane protease YdiL (CAAX protease family)